MSATLSLPQSIAVELQTALDADFARGIGWCFHERFIRHHIINTLARISHQPQEFRPHLPC